MRLYYHKRRDGVSNFGDDLNPWLWSRLLPGFLDTDDSVLLVGVGTLLNDQLPKAERTLIFGSGVGYGKGLPTVDGSWRVYCVRGPLSAKALELPAAMAITDPAVLVPDVGERLSGVHKVYRYSFMPHIASVKFGWQLVCHEMGYGYIDPRWSTEAILTAIQQTEILVSEALHGAIVADSLRVPWIAVQCNRQILALKWMDWCASMDLDYEPKNLDPYWLPSPSSSWYRRSRNWARRKRIELNLLRISKLSTPKLSKDRHMTTRKEQLWDRLELLKRDIAPS